MSNFDPACRPWHRIKTLTDARVEADEHGGLWITLPSGRRYYRPAQPVLDHPGLITEPSDAPEEAPGSDPDPPTHPDDTPPF